MRIRRLRLALVLLLIPAAARAHEHRMDLYGGAALESGSVLAGLHGSLSVPLPTSPIKDVRVLSLVGDLSTHWGSDDKRKSNLMGGLRYTFARDTTQRHLPFVQVLAGGAESQTRGNGGWDGALAIGVGFDSMFPGAGDSGWGIRAQADYIVSGGDNGARFSVGILKRWPRKH